MTSKEALERIKTAPEYSNKNSVYKRYDNSYIPFMNDIKKIEKDLEILEIIKENPELVWWCVCYETAEEMIIDRKGFMLNHSMNEIIEQFNKVKEWLNEK